MTAAVFLHKGFKVFLLEGLVPTPFVAFAVTHLKCAGEYVRPFLNDLDVYLVLIAG
jgi:phosphomannomutase